MSSHPDADAFVCAILRNPAEVTTRLIFADWLEEQGDPSNVAWAHFIRLNAEIAKCPANSYERPKLERQRTELAAQLRATLSIPASVFVASSGLLLELLPSHRFRVTLAGFEIPRAILEYMPESVARENLVLPISLEGYTLTITTADPNDYDTIQKLQFILNKDIIAVGAEREDIRDAIIFYCGDHEYEYVDSVLVEFGGVGLVERSESLALEPPASTNAAVIHLVNLIIQEAINLRADCILLAPSSSGVGVSYRIRDEWVPRDELPFRLLTGVAGRIALISRISLRFEGPDIVGPDIVNAAFQLTVHGINYIIRTSIEITEFGPRITLDISRQSVTA
ncbi:MAG: TIGR02996 domain-containing protein [Planctomycetes bacterium]|nr:TIGR02996 domain-containing protein [Planctomycetota bacterium]